MSEKIKLSELRSARAVMTFREPWTYDVPEDNFSGATVIRSTQCTCTGTRPSADHCPACNYVCDFAVLTEAPAIVATHNAADALTELAEAALEWCHAPIGQKMAAAHDRLVAALARFEP